MSSPEILYSLNRGLVCKHCKNKLKPQIMTEIIDLSTDYLVYKCSSCNYEKRDYFDKNSPLPPIPKELQNPKFTTKMLKTSIFDCAHCGGKRNLQKLHKIDNCPIRYWCPVCFQQYY